MIQSPVEISGSEMLEAAVSLAERTIMSCLDVWLRWNIGEVDMCLVMLSEAEASRMEGGGVVLWFILAVEMWHSSCWTPGLCCLACLRAS